jgi:hypothetical protein
MMTTEELKATLIACINAYSLKTVLTTMAEIIEDAIKNQPGFGWTRDARIIRSAASKVEN